MYRLAGLLSGLVAALLVPASAVATLSLEPIGSFSSPVFVTSEPHDPDRLVVVEQGGRVMLTEGGIQGTLLDLTQPNPDLLVSGGERGLLSAALAPDYASSGRIYVFYTRNGTANEIGDLQLDEFKVSDGVAPISSRRPVLTIDHESFSNHNGGQLQFGPDGYLYLSTGDGGGGGDPLEAAQSLSSELGKILRIDPRPAGSVPYGVPATNPFVDGTAATADEIWSYGLRNPWRFSFDRLTGDLLIGDVGQGSWEEIDLARAPLAGRAVNFGWDCREGRTAFETSGCPPGSTLTDPIHQYANPGSGPAAVTGGYVVRDPGLGELYGRYLYADVYSGAIRSLVPAAPDALDDRDESLAVSLPSSFGEDSCGRLYVTSLEGPVYRLQGEAGSVCPAATSSPQPTAPRTCAGLEPTIEVDATGRVEGTPSDDVIATAAGTDRIRGGGGADTICSGGGDDRLRGGGGDDRLRGGAGADRLGGDGGTDQLRGGGGEDRCLGGGGEDRLRSC